MKEFGPVFSDNVCVSPPTTKTPASRRVRAVFTSLRRRVDGQSLVEFALTLPMLLLVVTGLCAFGIAINNYLQLTDGVNVGSRQVSISRGQTTDPCSTASTAVINAASLLKPANMSFKLTLNGTSYTGPSCSSSSTTTGAAGNMVQGTTATLLVTYPCSLKVYGSTLVSSCTLSSQTSVMVQ